MRSFILGLLFAPLAIAQPLSGRVTSAEEGAMEGVQAPYAEPRSYIRARRQ